MLPFNSDEPSKRVCPSRSEPPLKKNAVMRVLAVAFLLAITATEAAAVDYCVGSVAQLQSALDDAEVDGDDSVIRVRAGTYAVAASLVYQPIGEFTFPAGKLLIRGGYNADCSSASNDDGATRLTGNGTRTLRALTQTGDVTLTGLAFEGVLIATFLGGGGTNNSVIGNLIGVGKNGFTALPNGTGVRIGGPANEIRDNIIGGNGTDGVRIAGANATGNQLKDNDIGGGVNALSTGEPNGRMGVMVDSGAHSNAIGPNNVIGRNGDDGVRIFTDAGGRNQIFGNRIYRNDALGIDLDGNGVSAIDNDPAFCAGPGGCAANRGQNFPVIRAAERRTSGITPINRPVEIRGTLRSTVGGPYRIEFFAGASCDANDHGEGDRLLGTVNLTIANEPYCPTPGGLCVPCAASNCTKEFTLFVPELDVAVGTAITATATSPSGDTSEFSECRLATREPLPDDLFRNSFEWLIGP